MLMATCSYSHTRTHTHSRAHTLSLSFYLSLSLFLSHAPHVHRQTNRHGHAREHGQAHTYHLPLCLHTHTHTNSRTNVNSHAQDTQRSPHPSCFSPTLASVARFPCVILTYTPKSTCLHASPPPSPRHGGVCGADRLRGAVLRPHLLRQRPLRHRQQADLVVPLPTHRASDRRSCEVQLRVRVCPPCH